MLASDTSENYTSSIPNLCGLSQNEARVLFSLVRWPQLADKAISHKIGLKTSTFFSVKNRLRDNGYFKSSIIPNLPKLGFEVLMIMFNQLINSPPKIKLFPNDFYKFIHTNRYFRFSIANNTTQLLSNHQSLVRYYSQNSLLLQNELFYCMYPFEVTKIFSFFDYDALLAKNFGYVSEPYASKELFGFSPSIKVKLNKSEQQVLIGLIQYPEGSNMLISSKMNISRNTVARARQRFLKEGICFIKRDLNLVKLGFKLLVFSYWKFNPSITINQRSDASEMTRVMVAPHIYLADISGGIAVSAHVSNDEYIKSYDELLTYYSKYDYLDDEPIFHPILLDKLEVVNDVNFYEPVLNQFNSKEN
jgi:predicted transcriptional regulator